MIRQTDWPRSPPLAKERLQQIPAVLLAHPADHFRAVVAGRQLEDPGAVVDGNTLTGTMKVGCTESCSDVIAEMGRINTRVGDYAIGIEFRAARKSEVPDVTIEFKSFEGLAGYEGFSGYYDPFSKTISLNTDRNYLGVIPHEVSHVLGGAHQPNITRSIKSCAPDARKEFTAEEMKDVVDAYR